MKLSAVLLSLLLLTPARGEALCRQLARCCKCLRVELCASPAAVYRGAADAALVFDAPPAAAPGLAVRLLAHSPAGEAVYLLAREDSRLWAFAASDACESLLQELGYLPAGGLQSRKFPASIDFSPFLCQTG